jgi:hypothetical protein
MVSVHPLHFLSRIIGWWERWSRFSRENKGCVTMWPWPFTLKSILRQKKKKNYENSNISPSCKNIIFKKSSKRNPKKILQNIIITLL